MLGFFLNLLALNIIKKNKTKHYLENYQWESSEFDTYNSLL